MITGIVSLSPPIRSPIGRSEPGPSIYYALAHEEFPVPQLVEIAVEAELAGFDGAWASDHFQPWQANEGHGGFAWMSLAAITQRTIKLSLGTGVTCPGFRYRPAIVAQAWASLSMLAPGRVFLGVGAGENLNEGASGGGWGPYEERRARMIESVEIIRELWRGKEVQFKGRFWEVKGKLYDTPAAPIPIYIAAGGPKSAQVAGRYGDGLITGAHIFKDKAEIRNAWEEAVRASGRDPKSQKILVEHWAFVGDKEDARKSAEKWRFTPKAWRSGFYDNISPRDIQARAEDQIPIEDVYKGWTISADPEEHIHAIRELFEKGATHVTLHVSTPKQQEAVRYFGAKVLPAFRHG